MGVNPLGLQSVQKKPQKQKKTPKTVQLCSKEGGVYRNFSHLADIDECRVGTTCGPLERCSNVPGSFYCACLPGYHRVNAECTGMCIVHDVLVLSCVGYCFQHGSSLICLLTSLNTCRPDTPFTTDWDSKELRKRTHHWTTTNEKTRNKQLFRE